MPRSLAHGPRVATSVLNLRSGAQPSQRLRKSRDDGIGVEHLKHGTEWGKADVRIGKKQELGRDAARKTHESFRAREAKKAEVVSSMSRNVIG